MKQFRMRFGRSGRRILLTLLAASVLVTAAAVGGIYAKYVYRRDHLGVAKTSAFYFESDLLTPGGATYLLNPGTTEVSFTLSNAADSLRFSDDDISYTVTATNGSFSATESVTEVTGTLTKAQNSTHTVSLYGLQDGGTYTVTARGEADFAQTLTATFTVATDPATVHMHTDTSNDAYVVLTVWTKNLSGSLSIDVPSGLIPDNTDPKMQGLATGQDIEIALGRYSSLSFRFFVGEWDLTTPFAVILTDANGEIHSAKVSDRLK